MGFAIRGNQLTVRKHFADNPAVLLLVFVCLFCLVLLRTKQEQESIICLKSLYRRKIATAAINTAVAQEEQQET